MTNINRLCLTTLIFAASHAVNAASLRLGNDAQAVASINGPQRIETQQGTCRYSFEIGKNTHARYNDPEIIVYQSQYPLADHKIPYLIQAETSSGYDWIFSNPGSRNSQWFGMMCESAENFPFNTKDITDASPEFEQVIEANGRKCPAELHDGKFTPQEELLNSRGYVFKSISYNNWNGFILTHKPVQNRNYDFLRFCLIHKNSVVVGTTENQSPSPLLDEKFIYEVESTLKTLKFNDTE